MLNSVYTGASALKTFAKGMEVVGNNVANVNSLGFKSQRPEYTDGFYKALLKADSTESNGAPGHQIGSGTKLGHVSGLFTQGAIQQTGVDTDLAIYGEGFFQVRDPLAEDEVDSTFFTRAGNFSVTAEGTIVTGDGLPLIPQITVPQGATSVSIGNDGTVSATLQGESEPSQLGQIEVASFMNPSGLQSVGGNLLVETAASGTPQVGVAGLEGRGVIRSGYLETSNVNIVEELVDMIETQRAYEVNSKMIKATDEMLQYVNQNI